MNAQRIARALGGDVSGSAQILAPGPGHTPKDRSLSIRVDASAPDGFVVHSFAGDDPIACKDYVREKIGVERWEPNGRSSRLLVEGKPKAVARYSYTDEAGDLLYEVLRLVPKGFWQRRPDGKDGWLWSLGDVRRVPYRLPEILEAIALEHPVFIAEGEKAVDELVKLGVQATCSPGGAGKWRDDYSEHFRGAEVFILADNDKPGKQHAQCVAAALSNIAASVRVMNLPGLPDKGDPFDWIKAGGTAETLWKLAKTPEPKESHGFTLVRLSDVDPTPVSWVWPGYLARGKLTLLGGDPDLGKSMVSIDAAARMSKGSHWPQGARAETGSTVFLCSEDGVADTIRPRAEAAGADLDKLHVLESTIVRGNKRKTFSLADDLDMLGAAIKQVGDARLVVIDPVTSYMAGAGKIDSSSTTDVRAVLEPVSRFAEDHGVALLAITHPPKASQGNAMRSFTGSFAYVAAARVGLFVTAEPETQRRLLLCVKNNIGQKPMGKGYFIGTKLVGNIDAPYIQWDDAPVDMTADQAIAASMASSKDGGELAKAVEMLQELLADGPIPAKEGEEAANAHGISRRTLMRARKKLHVTATKDGFDKGWVWKIEG